MTWPLMLYALVSRLLGLYAPRHLRRRIARGKEDPARIGEKLGKITKERPDGRLIWLHAASVGESLSLLEIIRRVADERPELSLLVTTGTRTSATLMEERLPPTAFHQYAPLDAPAVVRAFLDHWRPDLAIWTESELWPNTLRALNRRGVSVLMVNGRISRASYRNWRWFPLTSRAILHRFDALLVQNGETARRLRRLGARADRVLTTGSLKEGARPLPHDPLALKLLSGAINGRRVWCAASTHAGEEDIAAEAHRAAQRAYPGALLILVPRHPERGDELTETLRIAGWTVAQRSASEPISTETEIYLADTLGEMGLWYRLAPVSLVGGSLMQIGGHNPFEPAALGSAILHGPHVENFESAYARLAAAGAAIRVEDTETLSTALVDTLRPDRAATLAAKAWDLASEGADATDTCLAEITARLDALDAPK
ncbi:MAG: 3-deoxy-D-manno-octulosonic acid transferase [Pseudomonadota bacterium]